MSSNPIADRACVIGEELDDRTMRVFVPMVVEATADGRVMFCIGHTGIIVTASYALQFARQVASVVAVAQGIEAEGRDAQRLGAEHESPVAEGDAPISPSAGEDTPHG